MAINRTPDKYKGFTFDGVDSKDFGVYISDTGAFNAPERDVEMIEIPGRNGAYALDKGRFNNIEVTYNAFVATDSESDYISGINALRNALCSRKGYCRLEDEFNPNEYRMAVYKSGLKVSSISDQSGEFTITFDCQPQRFLKSGETAVSVASGDTITNPTLFESHPLISAYIDGASTLNIGDKTIAYTPSVFGKMLLANEYKNTSAKYFVRELSKVPLNAGDEIYIDAPFEITLDVMFARYLRYTESHTTGGIELYSSAQSDLNSFIGYYKNPNRITFEAGTASTKTMTISIVLHYKTGPSSGEKTTTLSCTINIDYNGSIENGQITVSIMATAVDIADTYGILTNTSIPAVYVNSTASTLSGTVYVDLDIDEAYILENDEAVSLNNYVSLGSEPPVLKAGNNQITYNGSISNVRITPRWWEV